MKVTNKDRQIVLENVAKMGLFLIQETQEVGYIIYHHEKFGYKVWVDGENELHLEKYNEEDIAVQ